MSTLFSQPPRINAGLFFLCGLSLFARPACLPFIGMLLVVLVFMPFGWLPLIIFTILAMTRPGKWRAGSAACKEVGYGAG